MPVPRGRSLLAHDTPRRGAPPASGRPEGEVPARAYQRRAPDRATVRGRPERQSAARRHGPRRTAELQLGEGTRGGEGRAPLPRPAAPRQPPTPGAAERSPACFTSRPHRPAPPTKHAPTTAAAHPLRGPDYAPRELRSAPRSHAGVLPRGAPPPGPRPYDASRHRPHPAGPHRQEPGPLPRRSQPRPDPTLSRGPTPGAAERSPAAHPPDPAPLSDGPGQAPRSDAGCCRGSPPTLRDPTPAPAPTGCAPGIHASGSAPPAWSPAVAPRLVSHPRRPHPRDERRPADPHPRRPRPRPEAPTPSPSQ